MKEQSVRQTDFAFAFQKKALAKSHAPDVATSFTRSISHAGIHVVQSIATLNDTCLPRSM